MPPSVIRALLLAALLLPMSVFAQQQPSAPAKKQFIYVLKLVPRLHDDTAWTPDDQAAVQRHFQRLKQATAEGRVIFAGRSDEPGAQTFGLVLFDATDEADARSFMNGDDAVHAGVMTAELHPFQLVLQRK